MTTYLLINTAGSQVLREEQFDAPPPALAAAKGVRWIAKDDAVTELAPACLTAFIASEKASKIAACDLLAKAKRDAVTANISAAEMASWPIKRAEAQAWQAAGLAATDADAPNLAQEALARNISTALLVSKVLTKAAALAALEAGIAGVNGKHNDAIAALSTLAELNAIDITTGWPV